MNVLELLSQLRQAKISLTLDGEKLKIKAPQGAITPEIKQQLQAAKADIIEFLKETQSPQGAVSAIPSIDRSGELPLSYTQVALWTMDKLNPGSIAYNLPMAFKFSGQLDETILEQAISQIISRHESLRLRIVQNDAGEPIARFSEPAPFSLPHHGVRIDADADYGQSIRALVDQYAHKPFDLEQGPLYRFDLINITGVAEPHQVLVICLHHIISDGLSQNLLVREVALTYAAILKQQPSPLPPLPIQYVDFAAWQREQLQGEKLNQEIAFWQQQLNGVPSLLALPTDRPRPVIQTTRGAKLHFEFDQQIATDCMEFCQARGLTLFMGLMTAFQAVLSRHAQQEDFCLGMPTAGRHQKEVEQLIGFFVNGVLVRADVKRNPSWNTLLDRVKNRLLDVLSHQQTPAQLIFDHLDISRNPSYPPLAQVGFQLQNFSGSVQSGEQEQVMLETFRKMTNLNMQPIRMEEADSKFDMILSLAQQDKSLSGYVEYNTDLFDESTINRMVRHFILAVKNMVAQPQQRILDLVLEPVTDLAGYLGLTEGQRVCRLTTTQLAFVQDLELRPDTQQYAVGFRYKIEKAVDIPKLKAALYHVVNTHGTLRARYRRCDLPWCDPAYQIIDAEREVPIDVIDVSQQPAVDDFVERHFDQWCYRKHDIFNDSLSHFQILTNGDESTWLTLSCHHIVIDGMSGMAMLLKIISSYEALLAGQELPSFDDGFLDYIDRHHSEVDAEPVIEFWQQKSNSVLPLSYTPAKSWHKNRDYQILQQPISDELLSAIKVYCRKNKTHPSVFYRLIAALVIQQYCRPEADFVLWDIQSGRTIAEESDIGVFYQQVPFIIPLDAIKSDACAADFYQQQRLYRREIKNRDFISLAQLNRLFPTGSINFQFNYFNFLTDVEMDGSSTLPYTFSSHVDNTVQVFIKDYGSTLEFELWMDGAVFVPQQFLQRMQLLVEQLVAEPDLTFSELKYNLPDEAELIQHWNSAETELAEHETLVHWIEQAAQQWGNKPAVISSRQTLTYQQLNESANRLARLLQQQGVGAGSRIGICLGRSPWMLVAVYGVLKAGASYIPIEPSYPKSRIEYILEDSAAQVLISEHCLEDRVGEFAGRLIVIDQQDLSAFSAANLELKPASDHAIYTIYTSGSTGNPKGASVTHTGTVNLQTWYTREAEFSATSRSIIVSAFGFDLTQKNLFAPLLCGGAIVLPSMDEFDPEIVRNSILEQQVTHINCAPSAFYAIAEQCDDFCAGQLQSLLKVYLGGEPIRLSALQSWLQHPLTRARVINSYGPTECTDVVSSYILQNTQSELSLIPIGKPINNTQIYILNESLKAIPLGVVGEICIAGAGVGLGYLGKADLTVKAFTANPFGEGQLYKTGDLGRYLPDGNIEYIGRKDFQVKVRGLRIELGEIESAIKQLSGMRDALVLVSEGQLVAYALTDAASAPADWNTELRQILPEYMVPATLIALNHWPLTPNGKIDRKALPAADTQLTNRPYTAPRNDIEFALTDIWKQVLKVDRVGVDDSFFELGGHSLLATQIVSRIRKQFEIDLPIRDLIVHPTVAQLAERVAKAKKATATKALVKVDRSLRIPLSAAQKRMWLLDQIEPGNAAYHVPSIVKVKGSLNINQLSQAFSALVERHEALRTHFPQDQQGPHQAFLQPQQTVVEEIDVRDVPAEKIKARVAGAIVQPFDLAQGPLFRAQVFRVADSEYILLLVLHHAVTDGWSNSLLIRELAQMYIQLRTQGRVALSPVEFQYADFAVWQDQLLKDTLEQKLGYWASQLRDVPALELPLDKPRPAIQTFAGQAIPFTLSLEASQAISALATRFQSTQFMVLLAVYATLLQRYSGQGEFAIGTPVSGRERPELENIVGFFVNTIAVKVTPNETQSFEQLLGDIKESVLSGFEHQEVPFEQIVEELNPTRDMSRSPIFQVMLAYQNLAQGDDSLTTQQFGDIEIAPFELALNTAKFEQTLTLWPQGSLIAGSFTYNSDLFTHESAHQFISHFVRLCDEIAVDSSKALFQYEVLTAAEKDLQLRQWNQTEHQYDANVRIENWFRDCMAAHADCAAVVYGSRSLSYRELNEASDRIAQVLMASGVAHGDFVGIVLDRNLHLMSAILGVLKAGAVYVPIDAAYPAERIQFICQQSKIHSVLSRPHLAENIPATLEILNVDALVDSAELISNPELVSGSPELPAVIAAAEDLIYVIYTSGSTGTPKATGAYRRSEINLLNWYIDQFNMNQNDRVLLLSAIGFDLTQKNLFAPLLSGASLVIPDFQEYDPLRLLDLIEQQQITWLNCAPSAFYPLLADPSDWPKLNSLRYLFLGGEPINLARLKDWLAQSRCTLVNSYGPTECADIAAWHAVELAADVDAPHLPIGRPNYNVELYVLGEQQQLLPVGAVGELCIAGDGVGPGYLNQPELTEQAFLSHPFKPGSGEKIYRTGDRVRYRSDGAVIYLGRKDHQLKLRGYRIETGEIQSVLNAASGVKDCHIDAVKAANGVEQLVAWVIADSDSEQKQSPLEIGNLARHARHYLPQYMVPDVWLILDAFPLTPNGKIDRKALPKPDTATQTGHFVEPRTPLEIDLASIWQEVLQVDRVGIHDNFFELGGHSLLATQVAARIRSRLEKTVTIREFMSDPYIASLAQRIEQLGEQESELPLVAVSRQQRIPLSFAQQRLWLLDKIEPGTLAYNVPTLLRIKGKLDSDLLEQALAAVFNRHEGLRTRFAEDEEGPYQEFLPQQPWALPVVDVAAATESRLPDDIETELKRLVAIELMTPFQLDTGPLFRAKLFRLSESEYVFSVVIHHVVTDGWSMNLLIRDLANAYLQLNSYGSVLPAALAIQYGDFASWQRARLTADKQQSLLDYWIQTLGGIEPLTLPTDFVRPPVQTYNGDTLRFTLAESSVSGLKRIARDSGASLFAALMSAWSVLLQRYSGQQDFCIGTPVAGREHTELENTVGFFVNTLAIRVQPRGNLSFRNLVDATKARLIEDFSHQEVPFEQIVEALDPARDMSRSPLFQVMLVYQNLPVEKQLTMGQSLPGDLVLESYDPGVDSSKYEMTLTLWDNADALGASLQYNTDLFAESTIRNLVQHFQQLLQALVAHPDQNLSSLDFLAGEEKQKQLREWNQTEQEYDSRSTLHQAFIVSAGHHPEHTAVQCDQQSLSYRQLDALSSQMAHYLISKGVKPEDRVAICVDRNLHLMTVILGVLKAGATYVPLDSSYPGERIHYIVESATANWVITQDHLQHSLPSGLNLLIQETVLQELPQFPVQTPPVEIGSEALLYLIFTSGSTGKPKGTGAYHRSEMNLMHWYINQFTMTEKDRVLLLSAIGFDLTQKNLFAPLLTGATLVIPGFQEFDVERINSLIADAGITWLNCAPSAFYAMQDEMNQWPRLESLRLLFLGGEPINLPRMQHWLRQSRCQLINSYGPTECTDIATWYPIDLERDLTVPALPIGRPNYNVRLYVLGADLELLPIGAIGELCIGGEGVGPGYVNNMEQTQFSFVDNPHVQGETIYRTGDRVRYRDNGVIEYLGRIDHQIKLRGYRIEAGEIQSVINQLAGVKDSLVDLVTDGQGVRRLAAWIMTTDLSTDWASELALHCGRFLPAFMLPEYWTPLTQFPLTPNGKVDRKALPTPEFGSDRDYVAPQTELENQLCNAWAKSLGLERIGVTDNFFKLGGQSLLATQLVSRVSRLTNRTVSVRTLFENPTVQGFIRALNQQALQPQRPPLKSRSNRHQAPLSFGQQRIWFFEQMNPGTSANSMPVAIRLNGDIHHLLLEKAFKEVIRRHEALRTCFTVNDDGEPVQVVKDHVEFALGLVDLTGQAEDVIAARLQSEISKNNLTPIPLIEAPLLKATLITHSDSSGQQHHLLLNMHHIISDGASQVVLFRELMTLYLAYLNNQPSPLPELTIHYPDFAQWQRDWMQPEVVSGHLQYWQNKLEHAPRLLELPLDYPRPEIQSTAGDTLNFQFDAEFVKRMREVCNDNNVTPFMFMLLGWKLLLSRYSGQQDILIGVPTLGRHSPELEPVIGFFIQSLVLRSQYDQNPVVGDALAALRNTVLEAFSHGDVPIDLIVERLGIPRSASYSPLVQVAFQLLDNAGFNTAELTRNAKIGNLEVEVLGSQTHTAKFDLTLNLILNDNEMSASLEYCSDLFKPVTLERLCQHYVTLCTAIMNRLDTPVHSLSPVEPQNLLAELDLDTSRYQQAMPLSAMQYDMFMDNLVNPDTLQSSHGWHIHIHSALDIERWKQCIQFLTDRQPMLRVRFLAADKPYLDMGYLLVESSRTVELEIIDLSSAGVDSEMLESIVRSRIYRPYNLQTDPLITHHVVKLEESHYVVITAVHHAVLDGAALNSYWQQLIATYDALAEQQLPAVDVVDFSEFVAIDRQQMDTASVLAFWRSQFSSIEPLDFTVPAPIPPASHFITRELWLDDEHWQAVKAFSRSNRITPSHYFKCLFGLMIKLYCRADSDFTIQETMGGRIKGHAEALGCYIQEIPFIFKRDEFGADKTFTQLLAYAREYQKQIKNQRLISIGKQLELSPRGRIGFMYNFYQFLATSEFLGETLSPEGTPSDPANNVQFVVTEVANRLKMNLFFHQHLFADFNFLQRIESISRQILSAPESPFKVLNFVADASERMQLLETWNQTHQVFDLSLCIHQKFENQALLTPQAVAILDDRISYSYQELNSRANQLAHTLINQGIQPNALVGLCAERSSDFLVGILGIMKAGAAYVPMDPKYPDERVAYMIENSQASVLVTQSHLLAKTASAATDVKRLCLDSDWPDIALQSKANPNLALTPRNRAYMIYTSGSTGMPKGAIVRHDGALNHIEAEKQDLQFPGAFSFLQSAPASSDISVWQFLGPVTCGGRVVVLDDVTHSQKLFELVRDNQVDIVELVPVALQLLMEYVRTLPESSRALPSLRWMMATGEAVSVDLVNEWLALYPGIPVVNAYGPSEAADDVIQCAISKPIPQQQRSVPIGKPLANLSVYIVDELLRLVPAGVPGEICIGGIGVGEGYWNNPEKTRLAFVHDPYATQADAVMYRTGDLGRWLKDGTVEYLDRVDNQVKIRGFRIELGEIESALSALSGVRENVVTVRDDLPGGKALAAYVVATHQAGDLDPVALRSQLRQQLPDFMVPAAIVIMEQLPLTPAGKIDRKALPRPEVLQISGGEYVAPRTDTEVQIAEIWQSLMPVQRISIRDNFFELGGHSLIGVRIMAKVNKAFGTGFQVAALLSTQTIEKLAQLIDAGEPADSCLLPIVENGKPAIFMIHPVGGDVLCYADLSRALADNFSVYGLKAKGLDGNLPPFASINELVSEYVHCIQSVQPTGPYRLLGQSLGGIFALAVAKALESNGQTVSQVVLLDSFSPNYLSKQNSGDDQILSSALGLTVTAPVSRENKNPETSMEAFYNLGKRSGTLPEEMSYQQFCGLYKVALQNHTLASQYEVENVEACVHHFTALDNSTGKRSGSTWEQTRNRFCYHESPGGHESMMQANLALGLGSRITQLLKSDNNNKE